MSRTLHHRKPGTPVTPSKRYIPTGKRVSALRTAMQALDVDLEVTESTKSRRTR